MQTLKSNIDGSKTLPAYPNAQSDIGYFLCIDRTTGLLLVQLAGGSPAPAQPDADGDTPTANPTLMAGVTDLNVVRTIKTTNDGLIRVSLEDATIVAGNLYVQLDAANDSVEVLQANHDDLNVNSNIQVGNADVGPANPVPTSDAGPVWTTVLGVSGARFTSADASGADAAVTDAPTAGQKLVIRDVHISVDTAMRVDLKEESSGTVIASFYMSANSSYPFVPRSKIKLATADKKLMVRTSAAGNVAVTVAYNSEA